MNSSKVGRCLSPLLIPPPRQSVSIDPSVGPASPLGALQPDLYRVQDGPIYLTAPESSPALGRLHLRAKYDYHLFDLTVHLIEGSYYLTLIYLEYKYRKIDNLKYYMYRSQQFFA